MVVHDVNEMGYQYRGRNYVANLINTEIIVINIIL
jgi:hypothetical protein